MLAAATIPYDSEEQDFTLQDLLEHLSANLSVECTMTEWKGFFETTPQVRVATSIPLTIQIENDPNYMLSDIAELVDRAEGVLTEEWMDVLRECTAKLEVMDADALPGPDEIVIFELDLATANRLDPSQPDIEAVIIEIARFANSLAYDNVNDEWLVPEG